MKLNLYQIKLHICLLLVMTTNAAKAQSDFVKKTIPIKLKISTFKKLAYGNSTFGVGDNFTKDIQPIRDQRSAHEFVKNIYNKQESLNLQLSSEIMAWLDENRNLNNSNSAIIILQHPLKLNALNPDNSDNDKTSLKEAYKEKALLINKHSEYIKKLETGIDNGFNQDINPAIAQQIQNLLQSKEYLLHHRDSLIKETNKIVNKYNSTFPQFIEEEKIETILLHKENELIEQINFYKGSWPEDDWSTYLLNVDQILIVAIGGKNDLQRMTLDVNNKASSFEVSLDELTDLATGLGLGGPLAYIRTTDQLDVELHDPIESEIDISFTLVNPRKIKFPSTINIALPDQKDTIRLDIHEKSYFQLKAGFSAGYVNRKQTVIDGSSVTVALDEDKKEELKGNLYALIDFYPWGRDLDRLEPIWKGISKSKKDIAAVSIQRVGITGGIRLSKDPFSSIFMGLSYAITSNLSLIGGIAYNAIIKDQVIQTSSQSPSIDYIIENADREVKPSIFIGVSLAPSGVGKLLSIK